MTLYNKIRCKAFNRVINHMIQTNIDIGVKNNGDEHPDASYNPLLLHDCYWQTCDGEGISRRTLSRKVQYSRTGTD